jgi:uncharacterized protein
MLMRRRRTFEAVVDRLRYSPTVVLLGPRQAGKTTLARNIADEHPSSVYLDLESPADREKLSDPLYYFAQHEKALLVLDEVQRMPELFAPLRGVIDDGRRRGLRTGRFLLLGSASSALLQQSESLAGRVAYVELPPLEALEVEAEDQAALWLRGGFPESLLAEDDRASLRWRQDFIRTYLERDIPQLGPRIPATTLLRFWTMLAHVQGGLYNASQLARGLAVDGKTIARYLDLMVDLMLVRRLPPYQVNIGKRLVKSPKVYVRDAGLVHALLNIEDREVLLGHPVCGLSWEGLVVENLISAAPPNSLAFFYRTAIGVEVDLLLDLPGRGLWAFEIKHGFATRPERGFYTACQDLQVRRRFVVNSGTESFRLDEQTEVMGLREAAATLAGLDRPTRSASDQAAGSLAFPPL